MPKDGWLGGCDEAGRGPWAGPVVAAAVVLKPGTSIPGLNDSKLIPEKMRDTVYGRVLTAALAWGVGQAEVAEVDHWNIHRATFLAMRRAVAEMLQRLRGAGLLLVDGRHTIPGVHLAQRAVIHGDRRSACVAAASVIAKVTRDRVMRACAPDYPAYRFDRNKGYGSSAEHQEALRRLGPTPLHRRSFRPVRERLGLS